MNHKTILTITIFALLFVSSSVYGQASKADSALIGIWKGTSICQVKNSPCKDEIVVYHISKGKSSNSYIIQANKIVNGKEEEMGPLTCVFDEKKNELISRGNNNMWTFKLDNGKLKGTLIYQENLYRIIEVTKEK